MTHYQWSPRRCIFTIVALSLSLWIVIWLIVTASAADLCVNPSGNGMVPCPPSATSEDELQKLSQQLEEAQQQLAVALQNMEKIEKIDHAISCLAMHIYFAIDCSEDIPDADK